MGRVVKFVGKVVNAVATVASFIPGPHQPLAKAIAIGSALLVGAAEAISGGPKIPQSATQLGRLQARLNTQAPRTMILGSPTALAVDIRYYEGSGEDEEYVDYIIALAAHRIGGVSQIWFEDELAWSATGGVQGSYAGYLSSVTIRTEGTAANTIAINGGTRWGSDDRLTGCAYLRLRVKRTGNSDNEQSPLASGLPGRVTVIGSGIPMYDPRYDSTVGGSGTQRFDDQNSWGPSSNNPIIQALNVLIGWRISGKLSVGGGLPAKYLDLDSAITAANMCDEPIALAAGGTQPRYRTAGAFSTDDAPMNVVSALLAGCAGDLLDSEGRLSFLIKANTLATPSVTFDDHDVISRAQWDPMGGQTNLPNIISGSHVKPDALYQMAPYPSVSLASEDGIDRTAPIDFGVVENSPQSERLAKQTLQRMQYPGTFTAEYNMKGMAAKVGSIVWQSYSPRAWVNKPFRVVSQKPSRSGRIALVLREEHEDIYAWEASDSAPVQAAEPVGFDPRNSGPILLARKAAQTADWPKVTDSENTKPEDNATVGAPTGTPVGDRTADDVTDAIDRHETDISSNAANVAAANAAIDAAEQEIDDLFETYGSTVSAAASADAAEQARLAAEQARAIVQAAEAAALQARDDAELASSAAAGARDDAGAEALAASGSANVAAGHAATATTKADEAADSASAASGSATAAQSSAGEASASEGRAATSASDAMGSANTAATSAMTAAEARDAAEGHASAASTSESNAAASAGNAASSASSASTSANTATTKAGEAAAAAGSAATSASNAGASEVAASNYSTLSATALALGSSRVALTPNGEFSEGLTGWTGSYQAANSPPPNMTPTNTSGRQTLRSNTPGQRVDLGSTTYIPVRPGRTYRATLIVRTQSAGARFLSMLAFHDAAQAFIAHKSVPADVVDGTWTTIASEYTVTEADGYRYVRAGAITNQNGTGAVSTLDVDALYVEDVTESVAAGVSASAAVSSAAIATAKAGEASTSASNAQQSQTAAGNSASAAQVSATSANAAATTAASSATLAANYSTRFVVPISAAANMWYEGVDPAVSAFKPVVTNAEGTYILLNTTDDSMYPVGALPARDSQRYKISVRWEKSGSGIDVVSAIWVRWYAADGSYLGGSPIGSLSATTFDPLVVTLDTGVLSRPANAAFLRFGIKRTTDTSGALLLVYSLQPDNITESANAEAQAAIATNQAVIATSQAAAARSSYELSARFAAGAMNPNPDMRLWETTGLMLPENWQAYGSSSSGVTARTRVTVDGREGIRLEVTDLTQATGIYQPTSTPGLGYVAPGAYVLEFDVRAHGSVGVPSGTQWKGVGLGAWWRKDDSSANGTDILAPATDPNTEGVIAPFDGTQIQRFRKLVFAPANTRKLILYLFANHPNAGGGYPTGTSRSFDCYHAAIRPATQEEVDANTVLPALEASVATNAAVLATQATALATLESTVSAHDASITSYATAIAGIDDDLDALFAKAGVKIDVNGRITGWEANNDGSQGNFKIHADFFEISKPGSGERTEYSGGNWRAYDAAGTLRVRWGVWP